MTAGRLRARLAGGLLALPCALLAGDAAAQANWREIAVPMYGPQAYARGEALALDQRASRLAAASAELTAGLTAYCAAGSGAPLAAVQAQWRTAVAAWDALSALSTGPLIERRSARSIDFMPMRPQLLERAIAAAPRNVDDLETIGAPARGFPALEWLLWVEPPVPGSPACEYARLAAADIEREARAIAAASAERVTATLDDDEGTARLTETVNQWLGGVEQLRWTWLRKPLEVAHTRGEAPAFPRGPSGQTASAWAARWATLRETAVLGERAVPAPGTASVPFETLLRGRGLNSLADRLVASTDRAARALDGLTPDALERVQAAAAALGDLARLTQDELAPALSVALGFSDADGD